MITPGELAEINELMYRLEGKRKQLEAAKIRDDVVVVVKSHVLDAVVTHQIWEAVVEVLDGQVAELEVLLRDKGVDAGTDAEPGT